MEVGKDVLYGYTGGMALCVSEWDDFEVLFEPTNFNHYTNLYLLADFLIPSLIN